MEEFKQVWTEAKNKKKIKRKADLILSEEYNVSVCVTPIIYWTECKETGARWNTSHASHTHTGTARWDLSASWPRQNKHMQLS